MSFWELYDRVRCNVMQFFAPVGIRFIFWLRRKLNLTVRYRRVLPPFPDPELTETAAELSDGTDIVELDPGMDRTTQTDIQPFVSGSNVAGRSGSSRNFSDLVVSLQHVQAGTPPEFAYIYRNQNFSYISDTDAGNLTTSTNHETDSD